MTDLLFHLWVQEDQRCPSLLAFPEDLEGPDHLEHRWDRGYPSVTNIKISTNWPKLLHTFDSGQRCVAVPLARLDQLHREFL